MAKKTDADGEWEETKQDNGITTRILKKPSAAYKSKLKADRDARPVEFIVCDRITLASGKVIDSGCVATHDLSSADITELKAAGKTVLKDGAVQ